MPAKSRLKCYFECDSKGPFHRFPNPCSSVPDYVTRYERWKSVLNEEITQKGDKYIFECVRLCSRHFVKGFVLPNDKLTRNSVPTLFLNKRKKPQLYKSTYDPPSCAVKIVADLVGFTFEEKECYSYYESKIQLPSHIAEKNPLGILPAITDKDIVLCESNTIMKYLLEKYGGKLSESLYPSDVEIRAVIDQVLIMNAGVIYPKLKSVVSSAISGGLSEPTQQQLKDIKHVYVVLETYLQKHRYIATDSLTVADIALGCNAFALTGIHHLDQNKFPNTSKWLKTLTADPNIKMHGVRGGKQLMQLLKIYWEKNKESQCDKTIFGDEVKTGLI